MSVNLRCSFYINLYPPKVIPNMSKRTFFFFKDQEKLIIFSSSTVENVLNACSKLI